MPIMPIQPLSSWAADLAAPGGSVARNEYQCIYLSHGCCPTLTSTRSKDCFKFSSFSKFPTSLLLGAQIQQHQEAVWAKDEHFHEQESRWKAQMQEMETFHMNNGRAITDQLNHLWHEHQLLVKQVGSSFGRRVQHSLTN
jgi:hypothetical protein